MRLQINEKKSKKKPDKINNLILKTKADYVFNLTDWLPFGKAGGREGVFKIERPRSRRRKHFGRRWTSGLGGFENWTIFTDITCVSSYILISFSLFEFTELYLSSL